MNLRNIIERRIADAARSEAGLAYIEFALCVGILLVMFFGAIEVSRYILIVQKVEKTIDTLTDVLTQSNSGASVDAATISEYLTASQTMMNPYPFGSKGLIILTGIEAPATAPTIGWQVCGGGSLVAQSALGSTPNAPAKLPLPEGFVMNSEDQEIVVGEIFYNYTPMLMQSVVSPAQVYRVAIFKPRFGQFNVSASTTCP